MLNCSCPVQHRFVRGNEPQVVQVAGVAVHGDVAFIPGPELGEHADRGIGGVVAEVRHPGLERVQAVHHPFDPANRQHGLPRFAPLQALQFFGSSCGVAGRWDRGSREIGRPGVLVVIPRNKPVVGQGERRSALYRDVGLSGAGGAAGYILLPRGIGCSCRQAARAWPPTTGW